MKNKSLIFILLIFCLSGLSFAQDTNVKTRFAVLTEEGGFFPDLKTSDIEACGYKNWSLELRTDNALEVMIMIDSSISQERVLPQAKSAAETFISEYLKAGKDKVAIVSFTGKINLEQDLTDDFQKAKEQLGKIRIIPPKGYVSGGLIIGSGAPPLGKDQMAQGATSIWDSIRLVTDAFSKIPVKNARRAIILISDGVNTYGEGKLDDAVEFSIKNNIPVIAFGIGDDYYGGVDKKALKKISEETGGLMILPRKKQQDLIKQLKFIEQVLRSHYEITLPVEAAAAAAAVAAKDKLQELKIDFINPELRKAKLEIVQPKGFFLSN